MEFIVTLTDTSVILNDFEFYKKSKDLHFVIPQLVLEELDNNKDKGRGSAAYNARQFFKLVKENLKIVDGRAFMSLGKKTIHFETERAFYENNDGLLSEKAMLYGKLITRDISMYLAHRLAGGDAELLLEPEVKLGNNVATKKVGKEVIDSLYNNPKIDPPFKLTKDYYILQNKENTSHSCLAYKHKDKLRSVKRLDEHRLIGFTPRSSEQRLAYEVLTNKEIPIVSLYGAAGTSKTFISLVAGLEMALARKYDKVLIARPLASVGEELGYLPGNLDEKLGVWLAPFHDNLEVIKDLIYFSPDELYDKIDAVSISHIRGRSLNNVFVIIDEAQNSTPEMMKTIASRIGANSKLVVTGDPQQIDKKGLSENNNGLVHLLKAMKKNKFGMYLNLTKQERSEIADFAAKNL